MICSFFDSFTLPLCLLKGRNLFFCFKESHKQRVLIIISIFSIGSHTPVFIIFFEFELVWNEVSSYFLRLIFKLFHFTSATLFQGWSLVSWSAAYVTFILILLASTSFDRAEIRFFSSISKHYSFLQVLLVLWCLKQNRFVLLFFLEFSYRSDLTCKHLYLTF